MAKVTMYTTLGCQYCLLAKRYLSKKGIEFTEVDITWDQAKIEELVAKTGQNHSPVFIIDIDGREEVVAGFDRGRLDELLGIKDE
jgi:glutaredoxin